MTQGASLCQSNRHILCLMLKAGGKIPKKERYFWLMSDTLKTCPNFEIEVNFLRHVSFTTGESVSCQRAPTCLTLG